MNKDLLKEAIADAKALRDTALANAKLELEEEFTPRLKSLVAAKLAEETSLDEEEDVQEQYVDDGKDGTPADPLKEGEDEDKDDMQESEDLDENDGLGVDELIRELELSIKEEDGSEDDEEEEDEAPIKKPADHSEPDGDEVNGEEPEDDMDEVKPMSVREKFMAFMDEILREMDAEEEGEDGDDMEEAPAMESVEKVKELQSELAEAYDVIKFLKGKLDEVHLVNSKLLYSNKIFRGFELNKDQKTKVLESFDRAKSVHEVKLMFTTICENLDGKLKIKRKTVTESMASRPEVSTAPKEILSEGADLAARFQKLANIKK